MSARDEDGNAMSDRQLRDETLTMLLAGHETTALALSCSFYLLGQHPEIFGEVVEEVAAVVGDRDATTDDVAQLKVTESVILEAMRLYPPAWIIGRESVGPFSVRGFDFQSGTTVFARPGYCTAIRAITKTRRASSPRAGGTASPSNCRATLACRSAAAPASASASASP